VRVSLCAATCLTRAARFFSVCGNAVVKKRPQTATFFYTIKFVSVQDGLFFVPGRYCLVSRLRRALSDGQNNFLCSALSLSRAPGRLFKAVGNFWPWGGFTKRETICHNKVWFTFGPYAPLCATS
jgi:hypothetical protein